MSPDTTVTDTIIRMSETRSFCSFIPSLANRSINPSCVLVVEGEKVIGILTERDIVRLLAKQQHFEELKIEDVMSSPVLTLKESELTDLFQIIYFLQQHQLRHLPIIDDQDHLVGLVTFDSLRLICRPIDLLRLRRVSEIMTTEVITTTPDTSLLAIAQLMITHQVSCIVIVASTMQPLGMITERDFVQFQALGLNLTAHQAEKVMSSPVFSIKPEQSVWELQQMLEKHLIRRLLVIGNQGKLCGVVTQTDLLKALNPFELYKLTEILQSKVKQLEAEKVILLENRNLELERQVAERTAAIKAQAEREKLLAEIATQIRSSLSLQTILETTVTEVRQLLQCDRVRIWQLISNCEMILVAESSNSPTPLSHQQVRETCFQNFQKLNSCPLVIRVVSDIYKAKMSDCHRQMLVDLQIRAKILVPLFSGDRLWGLLQSSESQAPRDWQPEEVELLQTLSAQLGIAIQQATTHQQLKEELKKRKQVEIKLEESEAKYASLSAVGIFSNNLKGKRQRMDASLQNLNEALRYAVEGISRLDLHGCYLSVNPTYASICGYQPEEMMGMPWTVTTHPDDIPQLESAYQYMIRHDKVEVEARGVRKDGSIFYKQVTMITAYDEIGNFSGHHCFMKDISDRKKAELALQESENRFRRIFDSGVVGMIFTDFNGKISDANECFLGMLGYTRSDLQENQINWANITPSEYKQQDLDAIAHLRLHGEITPWEKAYYHKDGHQVPVMIGVALISEDRIQGNCVCVILDISPLKQAESFLKQQANREGIVNAISQRIRASLNLQDILNTTVAEVHQLLWTDRVLVYRLLPNGKGKVIAESVSPDYDSISDQIFSQEIFPPENYEKYLQGRIFDLTDRENGNIPTCLVGFLREIGVRAKLVVPIIQNKTLWGLLIAHQCEQPRQWQTWEIELLGQLSSQLAIAIQQSELYAKLQENHLKLLQTNEELARATRLKDEFLANMSHELRTPLNAILGLTEGLQEEVFGQLTPEQRKTIQTIERSGSHLLELINDILDVAKIESGQLELDCTFTAIAYLCQSSITFIKQQALKKHIHLKTDIIPNLPELWLDERRMRQVLINLLNNAVKFTPEGGQITLTVNRHRRLISLESPPLEGITRIRTHRTPWERDIGMRNDEDYQSVKHYIQISIKDTGIGIAPEDINKLFKPFIQIDSALNRQYAGTGLGLALVKRIVELHGGDVTLSSELGKGSCFAINLPYIPAEKQPFSFNNPSELNLELSDSESSDKDTSTEEILPLILLAEDNEANISTISSYLKAKGYRIILAKNGQEAIKNTELEHPDIILMDIQMPGMDGFEAIKIIRNQLKLDTIPIIALTALAMEDDREKCLAAGANEYLSKPVKLKSLVEIIQQLLKL
jgi:PAS domain S-box-containing protein